MLNSFDDIIAMPPSAARSELMRARLIEQIDDICESNKDQRGSGFNTTQLSIIKDVSFTLLHILDPKSKPPRKGFWKSNWCYFVDLTWPKRMAAIFAVVIGAITLASGALNLVKEVGALLPSSPPADDGKPKKQNNSVTPPAASSPSTPG